MKMAKASKADIKAMQEFFDTIEEHIEEYSSAKKIGDYVRQCMRGVLASARNRVILGCDILIDNVCDPDKDYLDYKPELKSLLPETKNEQGEKLFYVISYTHSHNGILMLWGANNAGYTSNVKRAGKYTESKIRANMSYYHQGDNAVAISVAELHEKFQISENVWMNGTERQKHMARVRLGVLTDQEMDQAGE